MCVSPEDGARLCAEVTRIFRDHGARASRPRARLAFGYVMNKQGRGVLLNERGQSLVDAAYRALGYRTDRPGRWV